MTVAQLMSRLLSRALGPEPNCTRVRSTHISQTNQALESNALRCGFWFGMCEYALKRLLTCISTPVLWMFLQQSQKMRQPPSDKGFMVSPIATFTESQASKTRFVFSCERDVVAQQAAHLEVMGLAPCGNLIIMDGSKSLSVHY